MIIYSSVEEAKIRKAGEISTVILDEMRQNLKIGTLPSEIERITWDLCKKHHVIPSFYGVKNGHLSKYRYSTCISVNDEILHGIPSSKRPFANGDVVKLDFGINYKGYNTDHCYTFILGDASPKDLKLVKTAKLATESALKLAVPGNTTGDIGSTMFYIARDNGYDVLKDFVGHGIGTSLHEEPDIPAYGIPGRGDKLVEGMVICIESQVVTGTDETIIDPNGWTVKSADGEKSAMFEYMVIVRKNKPEILTQMSSWPVQINN